MKDWRNETNNYWVIEQSKKNGNSIYLMICTGEEIAEHCKMKNEFYGFHDGCGDKSYSCVAFLATPWSTPKF